MLKEHRKNGRRTGRFKWKGTGEFRSVAHQSEGYDIDQSTGRDGWIRDRPSKIGWFDVRAHRNIPNTEDVKRVILKKAVTDEWFVYLVTGIDIGSRTVSLADESTTTTS